MGPYDLLGQTVCETYVAERVIGAGTMGVVLEVRHVRLPRRFAMKVLHRELAEGGEMIARFRREAEIASSLGHPHIVSVVDWNCLPDGTPFLVMELLEGEDLHRRMLRGPLPLPEALELARQVGSALSAAHKHGVVHRDLKPQNVFLCREDRGDEEVEVAKVLDFGISKVLAPAEDGGTFTGAMRVMGTPLYMAPEQAMGLAAGVDGRADQFALAAILYHALSGQRPFDGASAGEITLRVLHHEPPPLRALLPDLPEAIDAALRRALSKDRQARFATIPEFMRALGIARTTATVAQMPGSLSGVSQAVHLSASQAVPLPAPEETTGRIGAGTATQGAPLGAGRDRLVLGLIFVVSGLLGWGAVREVGPRLLPPRPAVRALPPPPPPPEVRAPVRPRVRLRFTVTPPGAEIWLDGKRVYGEAEVEQGEAGLPLEVKAHGYQAHTEMVVPSSDQRIIIHLARRRASQGLPVAPF